VSAMAVGFDAATPRKTRFLQPGQLVVSADPMQITTILGSCVAVCLWDSQRRVGGMNHFMLPLFAGSGASSPRFGNVAMTELLEGIRAAGGRLPFLQARVFGGACMFEQMQSATHLGQKNVDLAIEFLARNCIDVIQLEFGGKRGRKLTYRTDEGTACLNLI
jgi:chemotaxis protein CheD